MGVDEELVRLFDKASKAAENASSEADGGPEEARCVEAIDAMHAVPVTTALLISTKIGKRLRHLTKHSHPKIQKASVELLELWKKLVATEATKNGCKDIPLASGGGSSKSSVTVKVQKKIEKTVDVKLETTEVKVEVPCTETSNIVSQIKTQRISTLNAPPSAKLTSSSNISEMKDVKPLNLDLIPKTNESTRDKVRELIAEALGRVGGEAEGDDLIAARSIDPIRVAVSVETIMFETLGLSKGVNKTKYRSIIFNIRDPNNPDFRRRILLGEIRPVDLINLTAEEMASDQRKLENQEIKKKALFECERGNNTQKASTDQFKCAKCKQRKCTYFQMQTRSADEPMTTFVTCVNCNNRWKFC